MNSFNYKKATQAINYFAKKSGGDINMLKVIKLMYFADKYHLRKYGRTIFNDTYFAMPRGPVASGVKDIIEQSEYLADSERAYAKQFITAANKGTDDTVSSLAEINESVFSQTDRDALAFVFDTFSDYSATDLVEVTHKYPEWTRFKTQLESNEATRKQMNYSDFFSNPVSQMTDDKFALDADILKSSFEMFNEQEGVTAQWA